MASSSSSSWKTRFSQKQLERKRLVDRISQRRARQQSRQAVEELEERIRLLSGGQYSTLIKRLMDDNTALQNKVMRYQAKIDEVTLAARDFLEGDGTLGPTTNTIKPRKRAKLSVEPAEQPDRHTRSKSPSLDNLAPASEPGVADGASLSTGSRWILNWSIYSQITLHSAYRGKGDSLDLSMDDFLESVMMWKLQHRYTDTPFGLLLDYVHRNVTCTQSSTTAKDFGRRTRQESFWQDILASLLMGKPLPDAPDLSSDSDSGSSSMTDEIRCQRRAAAYCAYLAVEP